MFIILGFYKSNNESKGRYVKSNTFFPKNRFEGKSTKTKAKNPNKVSKRGTTNSTNNSTKTRFQNQNRACKGANRSIGTKFLNQNRTCRGTNKSTKTRFKYQSRRRFKNIYHKSDLQPHIQKYLDNHWIQESLV